MSHCCTRTTRLLSAPLLLAIVAGCGGSEARRQPQAGPAGDAPPAREELAATVGRGVSHAVTVSPDGAAAHVWVAALGADGSDRRLFFQSGNRVATELRDTLGRPTLDPETPPKLAVLPDGRLIATYLLERPDRGRRYGNGYQIRAITSNDGGRSWSEPVGIVDGGALGTYRNDHVMHVAANGVVHVAWLDERVPGTVRVTAARSADGGRRWTASVIVDAAPVCECCRVGVTSDGGDAVFVAYRAKLAGGIRDVVLARSRDGGATFNPPVRLPPDEWVFDACPDAGPSIVMDRGGRLHAAWWSGREGRAGIRYSYSDDEGVTFAPVMDLGVDSLSRPSHVQLAVDTAGRVVVTWDDGTQSPARIALRTSTDRGTTFSATRFVSDAEVSAAFPVVALLGERARVVWRERLAAGGPPVDTGQVLAAAFRDSLPPSSRAWLPYERRGLVRLVATEVPLPPAGAQGAGQR